jgi:hypothetical protein
MQESYGEGVASHTDPESCAHSRKGRGEALTGARAGEVIEPRKHVPVRDGRVLRGADAVGACGRPHETHRPREMGLDPARSQNQRMHGHLSRGNREVPCSPTVMGTGGRVGKSKDGRRR